MLAIVDGEEDSGPGSDDLLNVKYARYISMRHSISYDI